MYTLKTRAYFRCGHCHAQTAIQVSLRDYDPMGYACDHCGEIVWVNLDDLRDGEGRRLISHRPFQGPQEDE